MPIADLLDAVTELRVMKDPVYRKTVICGSESWSVLFFDQTAWSRNILEAEVQVKYKPLH